MTILCSPCHDVMTKAENHMIAWRRRPVIIARRIVLGARSRHDLLPRRAWPYIGAACIALGLATDRWTPHAVIALGVLIVALPAVLIWAFGRWKGLGPFFVVRSNRSAAETIKRREQVAKRESRGTFLDARAKLNDSAALGWDNLYGGLIGMSTAYLLGVYGPELAWGLLL